MKLYLTDQRNNLKHHLDLLKKNKVMAYDPAHLIEKTTAIHIETQKSLDQLNLDFLFDYKIFPENIMTYKNQWDDEKRKMKIGDTIVQQVYLPPIKRFSQKIVFGVRIKEVFNHSKRRGFSYEALEGHVEKGISAFTVEQVDSKINFVIQTYSTPGSLISRLAGRFFSIPYQAYCTRSAIENVKRQLEDQ